MNLPGRFEHLQDSIPFFSVFIEAIESLFCISFLCKEWCNGSLPLQFYKFFARVDEAKKGSSKSFANVDELDKFIRAL